MATIAEKVRLSAARGHGVIYFFWEGLWGQFAGPEGGSYRQQVFKLLHSQTFSPGGSDKVFRLPARTLPGLLQPPPPLP
jgi:hypothetical protein